MCPININIGVYSPEKLLTFPSPWIVIPIILECDSKEVSLQIIKVILHLFLKNK
jgi:hypothetical protein